MEEYLKKQLLAVYKTRAAVSCEIGNLMHTPLCDQQLVNKSLFYLTKLRQESWNKQLQAQRNGDRETAAREEQTVEAYNDLMKQISAAKDEREKKSREAVPRFQELERQMREVYGGIKYELIQDISVKFYHPLRFRAVFIGAKKK